MFELDPRLANDCCVVGDLPLCRVLLMKDARYPWLILVPRRADISEVFDLEETDQHALWHEASAVAEGLKDLVSADKMNIATLGNVVSQLHVHVVARVQGDETWPAPVWGRGEAQPYSEDALAAFVARVQAWLAGDAFQPAERV